MKNKNKGFTLIELLVVIAIIGILASVVLASLNTARAKGADAAIKANLNNTRAQAELFYGDNNNTYLPATGATALSGVVACPTAGSTATMVGKSPNISKAIAQATSLGSGGNACYNTANAWAAAVTLKTDAKKAWCVDSTGQSQEETLTTAKDATGAISSTGACN